MKNGKRIIAILLAAVLVLQSFPLDALASEIQSGTQQEVSTVEEEDSSLSEEEEGESSLVSGSADTEDSEEADTEEEDNSVETGSEGEEDSVEIDIEENGSDAEEAADQSDADSADTAEENADDSSSSELAEADSGDTGEEVTDDSEDEAEADSSDFTIEDGVLTAYTGTATDIVIPDTVTEIGEKVFYNNTEITSLVLPDGLTTIDASAFYGCSNLTGELTLPDSLTMIGAYAFYGCNSLTGNLVIPDSVTTIGSYAFYGCSGFNGTLTLSKSLSTIANYAFYNCKNLTGTLTIPDTVTGIPTSTFANCAGLDSITFGKGIVWLYGSSSAGYCPFYGCSGVKQLVFNGSTVPIIASSSSAASTTTSAVSTFFGSSCFANLTEIVVLADSFEDYASAWSDSLQEGKTRLIADSEDSFVVEAGVLLSYTGTEADVTIPDTVTEISSYAFRNNTIVESVTCPESVTAIDAKAFRGCMALRSFTMTDSITSIGSYAFYGCSLLSEIVLPSSLTAVEEYTFYGCTALTSVTFPEKLVSIGNYAFYNCTSLTGSLELPETLTTIGGCAFYGCSGLAGELILPENVTTIGGSAFYGCSGLTGDLVIPNNVTEMGTYVFSGCSGLNGSLTLSESLTEISYAAFNGCSGLTGNLVIPDGVTVIDSFAFDNCSSLNGSLTLPESVTSIGRYAFYSCRSLNGELKLPNGVTVINENAFYACAKLTGVLTIPDSVTSIGQSAFASCTGLTGIVIGESVSWMYGYTSTYISRCSFYGCSGVVEITFTGAAAPLISTSASGSASTSYVTNFFGSDCFKNLTKIVVPADAFADYADTYAPYIQAQTRLIADSEDAFVIKDGVLVSYTGDETTITIPDTVTEIGSRAFQNNTTLISIQFPESVEKIGSCAFYGCTALESAELTNQITGIGSYAFYGCSSLAEMTLPTGLTVIEAYTFYNCSALSSVDLPETLQKVGNYAFSNCKSLTGVLNLPETLELLGSYAFYWCSSLTGDLVIPDAVTEIGDYAFYRCTGFNGMLELPDSLEKIGSYAFYWCNGLTGTLELPETLTSIGSYAFYNCSGLTGDLRLPDAVTTVGEYAFNSCSGFDGVLTLSEGLTAVSGYTFSGCSKLNGTLLIPDSVKSIGAYAFSGCTGFSDVILGTDLALLYVSRTTKNTNWVTDKSCFYGCSFESMIFLGTDVPTVGSSTTTSRLQYFFPTFTVGTIYVPADSLSAYESAWSSYLSDGTVLTSIEKLSVSNLRATQVRSRSVTLAWMMAASENVTGYEIYRDGEQIAETEEQSFTDSGLEAGTAYTYTVIGCKESGETTAEASVTVTTVQPQVLSIYTENEYYKVGDNHSDLYAVAQDDGNLTGAVGQFYYLDADGERIAIGDAITSGKTAGDGEVLYTTNWEIDGLEAAVYTVVFELTDADGATGSLKQVITVDDSVPAKISSVTATGDTYQIVISWGISKEADTETYYIYRRGEDEAEYTRITEISGRSVQSYTDTDVVENTKYYYYVTGVNFFGREGEASRIVVAAATSDTEAPTVVQLTPTNSTVIGEETALYARATDNIQVAEIRLYVSTDSGDTWTEVGSSEAESIKMTLSTADYEDGTIQVKAVAADAAGNESDALTRTYTVDNTGPVQVTGLSGVSTATTVTLSWDAVEDADFSFFRVEQLVDGEYVKVQDVSSTLGVNLYNLQANTEYTYRVVAYDRLGNRGEESESITVATQEDTTAPVITAIGPDAGYYNGEIALQITATDNLGIASVQIQTSANGIIWEDYKTVSYEDGGTSETVSETISLDEQDESGNYVYAEGYLYIRGIATDTSGNESESGTSAPYTQYIVDRTAPDVPEGLTADASSGAVVLCWEGNGDADFAGMRIFRSTDGETWELLTDGLSSETYTDRSTEPAQTYQYYLQAADAAGNVSEASASVTCTMPEDTEAPQILSVSPASGSVIGASNTVFRVLVSDNWRVGTIRATYTVNDDSDSEYTLISETDIESYYKLASGEIPVADLQDQDVLTVTVTVTDAAGHETVSGTETVYTIDRTAPQVTEVAADGADGVIRVSWSGWAESDLSRYRIYRRTEDGTYSLIAQKSAEDGEESRSDGSTSFLYEDAGAAENETYYYKVEAVDLCGNTASCESDAAWIEAELSVTASVSCDSTLQWGKEYVFDASASAADCGIVSYTFDFGDDSEPVSGTAARVTHTYTKPETEETEDTSAENEAAAQDDSDDGTDAENAAEGTYTLTLTVTDAEGNTASVTKTLTVADESLLGTAEITIVDENGDAISGVPVYFDMEHTTENIARTNVDGIASFTAEAGRYTVGAYDSGYLPVTRSVTVAAGETATLTITMTAQEIVSGEFEVNRMTLDEIVAAGFDVNDPANQNVVRVTLHLTYGSEPLDTEIYLFDGEGTVQQTVTTSNGKRNLSVALWIEDDSTDDDDDKGPGSDWTVTFGDGSSGSESMAIAILDVPVEASYLKEFFDVKFYLFNNASSSFELVNNVVSLDLPEGLTLMNEGGACDDAEVRFDSLGGQTGKTIEWILRGDQAGEYDLTASYSGVLSQFDTMVSALFQTEDPITVYGLDAIRLIAEINSTIAWGGLYFNLSLQNVGGADIYLPQLNVVGDIVNTYESYTDGDGTETTEETRSVTLLNTVYENASGYSQYLGTDETLNALAVGETYTRKYACYSAVTESDLEYLHSAVAEVAEEYGIEVEIRIVDMNLYSTEDADEILAGVSYSGETHDAYTYFTTNGNFNYYTYAEMSDQDFLGLCGEMLYGTKEALLDQDLDYFTGDDIKELTREYICEMLSDDSFQEAVDTQVDLTYLKVVKSVLGEISTVLGQSGEASVNDLINTTLSETATQMHLAMQLKTAGVDGFMDSLEKIGVSAANLSIKALLLQDGEDVNDFFADSFGKVVSGFGDAIGLLNDAGTAWVTSVEITNQFITISAAREQAEYVLTVLLEQMTGYGELEAIENLLSQIGSTAADSGLTSFEQDVVEELWDIYQSLEEGFATQEEVFVQELLKTEATSLTYKYVAKGLQKAFGVSSSAWNVVYIGLKVGSKILDKMIGAEETIDQIRSLRVAAIMTRALWGGVREAYYAGESIDWALSLKYLIKMRLIGERAWVTFNTEAKTEYATDLDSGVEYELDEYYIVFKEKVLSYRDILFGQSVTVLNVPDAPTVTVDYTNETTAETFDESYEYSFDGVYWTDCDGSTIALEPGTVGKYLWIRVAETAESYCGNTTKLYIPGRPTLSGDVLVVYGGGTYSFSGLTADVYCVVRDSESGETTPILLTVTDGSASLEGYAYASSVQLYYAGTASSFAGSVKEVSVYYATDEWTVTPDEKYDYTYDGTEKIPGITVKNADGNVFAMNTDYTVAYTDNINAGTATITVTGCGDYSGTVTETFTIDKASQTIGGADSYEKMYGDAAFILDAVAEQGTALSYTSSNPDVVDVDSDGNVTICSAGSATITVAAAETDNYKQAEKTIAIMVAKASQTISGTDSYPKTYGDAAFTLDAKRTAGDGALTYASSDEDVVKVSSAGVVTIAGAGSAVITVTAKETDNYNKAELSIIITVAKASQTVSGTSSYSDKKYGDAAFTLDAKTSGDGALIYESSAESVVTVSSAGVVTIKGAGSATITVTAKASTNYNESAAKTISITVAKASQTVTATAASSSIKVDTTTKITVSGTGTITYTSSDTSVATVNSSGTVTAKAKGTATITVKAAGDSNYNAASKTITIKVTALAKGDAFTSSSVKYKLTSASAVTVTGLSSKTATSATIPATVTYGGVTYSVKAISASAFSGYTKLKKVSVGSKVTSIGSKAFYKCTALTQVTGCTAVTSVGSSAFQGCSKLTIVKGLQKATSIGSKAFYGCTKLKTIGSTSSRITLAKVKTIGSSAFYKCTTLTYVNLASTALTKIDTSAFQGCTALKTFVSKSTKLTTIGKKAFYGDAKLASITLKTTKLTSSKVGASAFKGIKSTCTFKVPSAKISAYKKIFKAKGAGSKITVKKG